MLRLWCLSGGLVKGETEVGGSVDRLGGRRVVLNGGLSQCKGSSSDSSRGEIAGAGRGLRQHSSTQTAGSPHGT